MPPSKATPRQIELPDTDRRGGEVGKHWALRSPGGPRAAEGSEMSVGRETRLTLSSWPGWKRRTEASRRAPKAETLYSSCDARLDRLAADAGGSGCLFGRRAVRTPMRSFVNRLLASPQHGEHMARSGSTPPSLGRYTRLPGRRRTDHVAVARLGYRRLQQESSPSISSPSSSSPATCSPTPRRAEDRHGLLPQSHDQRRRGPHRRGESHRHGLR